MGFRTTAVASFLAISGGVFSLILPIAVFIGTARFGLACSIPPEGQFRCIEGVYHCPCIDGVYSVSFLDQKIGVFWVSLGIATIATGLLALVMLVRPRNYLVWSLPVCMGLEALLFWVLVLNVQGDFRAEFVIAPEFLWIIPRLVTATMIWATLVLTFGLAITNYPNNS